MCALVVAFIVDLTVLLIVVVASAVVFVVFVAAVRNWLLATVEYEKIIAD